MNRGRLLIRSIRASWSSIVIKVVVSAYVYAVRSRASGGCERERGEAVPTEVHCTGGIVRD